MFIVFRHTRKAAGPHAGLANDANRTSALTSSSDISLKISCNGFAAVDRTDVTVEMICPEMWLLASNFSIASLL